MEIASQSIFTFELIVKFMAEMPDWQHFFHDGWNCLDAFVVLTGYGKSRIRSLGVLHGFF